MRATVGDRVVIASAHTDVPAREGEVVGVSEQGEPPWQVRWSEDDHESVYCPGPDAFVEPRQ
ncbi:DUF1918 domain-containing protein [Ruania halotolerans]|uniref:DUF1918 domain-containing protein n=1 Tax=Ruania halotolerans TaxID=2897773 RepID=UPI001E32ACCA|nr:DUF1918 domain-containing protein [Ruania halotolerans]UFU06862.1 DUF1918 domain-containing protein [Ruania halotolerans]